QALVGGRIAHPAAASAPQSHKYHHRLTQCWAPLSPKTLEMCGRPHRGKSAFKRYPNRTRSTASHSNWVKCLPEDTLVAQNRAGPAWLKRWDAVKDARGRVMGRSWLRSAICVARDHRCMCQHRRAMLDCGARTDIIPTAAREIR